MRLARSRPRYDEPARRQKTTRSSQTFHVANQKRLVYSQTMKCDKNFGIPECSLSRIKSRGEQSLDFERTIAAVFEV